MTVLLIEDEQRIASFLVKGLEADGYAVEHVATGREALVRVGAAEPDAILLDLGLPDFDGLDLLRRLRRRSAAVPVIVLTARGDVGDRVRGFDAGADDYLTKPFAFDELLVRLRARLRRRPAAQRPVREADRWRGSGRTGRFPQLPNERPRADS